MNTFDLSWLRSKGPVKPGIYAQAAIKRGCCYSQNIYPKMCYYGFLTGSLYSHSRNCCEYILNMRENLGCLLLRQLEDVSSIIFFIIHDIYNETVKTTVTTAVVVSYQTCGGLDDIDPTCSLGVIHQEELNSGLSMSLIFCFARFFPAGLFPGHQGFLVRLPQRGIYDSPP